MSDENNNNQQPSEETAPPATRPAFSFGANVQLRPIKGVRGDAQLNASIQSGQILTGLDALRARGVRGRAASSFPNVFYGQGLVDENGYLARTFYNEDSAEAATVLGNMKPSDRQKWAAEAKRIGLYGSNDPSAAIVARGESFTSADENAMMLFLREANFNQLTVKAMMLKVAGYSSVVTEKATAKVAPMVSSPEDIGYYLNQMSLSMTGKPMTKALAKQLIEQYQQMERTAATSRVSAPSKTVFAQSAVEKAQPGQVAGNAVGKAIQLAFAALAGK